MKRESAAFPVAVIGAGPVGLAAAAHLLGRAMPFVVLEAGATQARPFEATRHVRLFSPWRYNVDGAARELLAQSSWAQPDPDALPTAGEMIDRYLAPLAAIPAMASRIRFRHRVTALARRGFDKVKSEGRDAAPFVVRVDTPGGPAELLASAVIDATGTWSRPSPLGAEGLPAIGEGEHAGHIAYGMPDVLGNERPRYGGKRILVAGAGHSAMGTVLALAQLAEETPGTRIIWALRGTNLARVFGGGELDRLPARGALGSRLKALLGAGRLEVQTDFHAREVRRGPGGLELLGTSGDAGERRIPGLDEIIVATGSRPDFSPAAELRVKLDPFLESTEALAPLIDPNVHSCGTVRPHGHRELAHPEPGYYAVGAKSYGRAPNFLLATGYEQVRSVVAALAGDIAAADDVRLELPETGVCSAPFSAPDCCAPAPAKHVARDSAGGADSPGTRVDDCCGGAPRKRADACCAIDELEKDAGREGCSGLRPPREPPPQSCRPGAGPPDRPPLPP